MAEFEYKTLADIEELVRKFESCELPVSEFKHRQHITVALWYLKHFAPQEAAERMRRRLRRLLNHYNLQGYNETLTLFWMRRIKKALDEFGTENFDAIIVAGVLAACGDSQLVYDYYSKERISSEEARESWIEPDLRPLDF
ncbi:MAG: hypothetical protein ABR577_09255 [Pyrinomonadaceae bacterium]